MSRQADCVRIRRVVRALKTAGCGQRRSRYLSVPAIARRAGIATEEAKTTVKTLRRRGWIENVQSTTRGSLYRFKEQPKELIMKATSEQKIKPTHHDGAIAAGRVVMAQLAELKKLVSSLENPKGATLYQIAEDILRHRDAFEEGVDLIVAHAAAHCEMDGQGDIVDEAQKAAAQAESDAAYEAFKARKAQEEAEVDNIVEVEAEPLNDEETDATAEGLPGSPLGLPWSDVPEDTEDEDDEDQEEAV